MAVLIIFLLIMAGMLVFIILKHGGSWRCDAALAEEDTSSDDSSDGGSSDGGSSGD